MDEKLLEGLEGVLGEQLRIGAELDPLKDAPRTLPSYETLLTLRKSLDAAIIALNIMTSNGISAKLRPLELIERIVSDRSCAPTAPC